MAYQVLARKWRPLTFEDVVNQDHVKNTLSNAISQNRIAHSYIFAGPRGVGKTTIARIFARAVNCENGPTPTPCNKCTPCVEIIEDRSMDVMEIDGASNRGIEDIRNIRENVKYSPVHGKYRIYIIDEVHMLTREAFNALLKTLEEPPPHVLFMFATTEFQKIPATIVSRCQRFDFKRIPVTEIVKQLKKISDAEKITIEEESMFLLARRSEGSMRDAESLFDQLISFCGTTIDKEDVFDVIGMIREEIYFSCSEAVINKKLAEAFTLAQSIFDEGYDPGEYLNGLLEHFRNILVALIAGNAESIETSEYFQKKYFEASEHFSAMDIIRIINTISDAEYQIKKSSQSHLRLELLLAKLISMDKSVSIDRVLSSLRTSKSPDSVLSAADREKKTTESSHVQEKQPEYVSEETGSNTNSNNESTREFDIESGNGNGSNAELSAKSADEISTGLSIEEIKARWDGFVDSVIKESAVTGSFLKVGTPVSFDDKKIGISFPYENGFQISSIERNRNKLNKNLEKWFGTKVGFTCIKQKLSQIDKEKSMKLMEKAAVEDHLQKMIDREPIIKSIIDTFGGESITWSSQS